MWCCLFFLDFFFGLLLLLLYLCQKLHFRKIQSETEWTETFVMRFMCAQLFWLLLYSGIFLSTIFETLFVSSSVQIFGFFFSSPLISIALFYSTNKRLRTNVCLEFHFRHKFCWLRSKLTGLKKQFLFYSAHTKNNVH